MVLSSYPYSSSLSILTYIDCPAVCYKVSYVKEERPSFPSWKGARKSTWHTACTEENKHTVCSMEEHSTFLHGFLFILLVDCGFLKLSGQKSLKVLFVYCLSTLGLGLFFCLLIFVYLEPGPAIQIKKLGYFSENLRSPSSLSSLLSADGNIWHKRTTFTDWC